MCAKQTGKIYYTMGEVTEMFDVNPSLIRFWESRFDILKPHKNKKGNRLFTPSDIENLKLIYHLVKEKGMTLSGAAQQIKSNREGISRSLEVVDRLLSIRAVLAEIKQELVVGADFEADGQQDYIPEGSDSDVLPQEPDTGAPTPQVPDEPQHLDDETDPGEEPIRPEAGPAPFPEEAGFSFLADEIDSSDAPPGSSPWEDDGKTTPTGTGHIHKIVSENIGEITGEQLPGDYIEELSNEIAEQAATAAEVMEALSEIDGSVKKEPEAFEQTLF